MKTGRFLHLLFFKALWLGLFLLLLWKMLPHLGELNPLRLMEGMATSLEMMQIEQALEGYRYQHDQYPADFGKFLDESFNSQLKSVQVDSWGTPYQFEPTETGYQIRSAGPDHSHGTQDDFLLVHGAQGRTRSGIRPEQLRFC